MAPAPTPGLSPNTRLHSPSVVEDACVLRTINPKLYQLVEDGETHFPAGCLGRLCSPWSKSQTQPLLVGLIKAWPS